MAGAGLSLLLVLANLPATLVAAPLLRSADARIEFGSAVECAVDLTLQIEDAVEVEHRLAVPAGARIDVTGVHGATAVGEPHDVGRTRALVLRPAATIYTLRYAVTQPEVHAGRCPLWIPAVSAGGRAEAVRLLVRIPANTAAGGTMPAFQWTGTEGEARLAHLPAFVRVPFGDPGGPAPRDLVGLMDVVAVSMLVLATLAWARRRSGERPSHG